MCGTVTDICHYTFTNLIKGVNLLQVREEGGRKEPSASLPGRVGSEWTRERARRLGQNKTRWPSALTLFEILDPS